METKGDQQRLICGVAQALPGDQQRLIFDTSLRRLSVQIDFARAGQTYQQRLKADRILQYALTV